MTGCDEWQTSVPDQEFIFELAPPKQDSAGKTPTNHNFSIGKKRKRPPFAYHRILNKFK